MTCTSGCLSQDHESWGDCMRAKKLRVGYARSATNPRNDASAAKAWDRELDLYARARKEGIQPDSTKRRDIVNAMKVSDATGVAYGT